MYYPRFTKVIVDYFMAKDQAIPRRNKMFWHYARDDFMFTTIRVISKHKDTQEYGAILPQHLTNQSMKESKAFKTYRAYDTGEKAPKSKATKKKTDSESSPKTKPSQASKGKRIKTSAKGDKPATTKSKGLTVLSEVALSEAEQMKLATKRSLKEFHISHASGLGDGVDILSKVPDEQQQTGSGTNEGAGDKLEHDNDDEDDDQENDSQRTESDDEGDDFVHPNLSTYRADDKEKEKEEEKADDDDDDVTSDEKFQHHLIMNSRRKMKINRMMILWEKNKVMKIMGNCIDSILNLNAAVSVTPSSATIIPQTPIPIIQPQQQTHDSTTTTTIPTTTVPEIPNFASLFGFEHRVSSLESDLSELKQTNQFAKALSSILGIVDKYLASKVKDTVDVVVQLKSNKLREEAQVENQDFLNSLDSNMKRIIKEQTSYAVASSLSELELKKSLMDKIEENNSIDRFDVQKNLYKALLKAYNSDKDILSSYGEVVTLKQGRDDQDKDKEPSAGLNCRSKRQRSRKEESSKEATQKESNSTSSSKGNDDVSPVREATNVDEQLWNPSGSRTPDREWNQTKTVNDRPPQ
ncbi:hypothetical protein Tco_1354160 [Tanacetum coccineum]